MRIWQQFKTWLCLLSTLLLLSGCGVKTFYNNLDWLVPYYVDDYISLNDDQQADLEKRLVKIIYWHRTTQLSEYSAFMRQTRGKITDGVTEAEVDEVFVAAEQSWQSLMDQVAPEIVDLLATATDEQKKELFDNIERRNEDFKEDYLDLSEKKRAEDRVEAMQKNFKRWLGSLTDEQANTIAHYSTNFVPIHNDRWLFRLRWQAEFRKLLYDDNKNHEVRNHLQSLFTEPDKLYTEDYRHKRNVNKKLIKEMILKMNQTITAEQYEYLFERIESYATIFEELSVQT